jgi:hypothetical protein
MLVFCVRIRFEFTFFALPVGFAIWVLHLFRGTLHAASVHVYFPCVSMLYFFVWTCHLAIYVAHVRDVDASGCAVNHRYVSPGIPAATPAPMLVLLIYVY